MQAFRRHHMGSSGGRRKGLRHRCWHALRRFGGRLAVLTLDCFFDLRENVFGAGTLFELRLPDLAILADHIQRKDQTLTNFGFGPEKLS